MSKFRAFTNYHVRLREHGRGHNLQIESNDSSHLVELSLTREQAFELLAKGEISCLGRINGMLPGVSESENK